MTTKPIADPTTPLVWIDVETTGLAPGSRILEIALVVTDADLQPLGPAPARCTIWIQSDEIEHMEPVAREMHERSGLLLECRACRSDFVDEHSAENWLLQRLVDLGVESCRSPLAGSSVAFDRSVLAERMPALAAYLHYRSIDVSTLIELAARWRPDLIPRIAELRRCTHRALPDLEDSITVLRLLRSEWLNANIQPSTSISTSDFDALFAAYHEDHSTWGSLHLVLEDGNLGDDHMQFCIQYAAENGDAIGCVLGRMLAKMSVEERDALSRRV